MKEINKIQLNTEEYIIEPPIANETIQGGILAKQKTNESVSVKIRDGKCFIPEYPNGDDKIDIAQSAQNKDKVMVVNNSGELEATEYKASNDNTLFGHIDKQETHTINDGFNNSFKNLIVNGKTIQKIETDIVPTPQRPLPIYSRKVKAGEQYVELRSLKESNNLFDNRLFTLLNPSYFTLNDDGTGIKIIKEEDRSIENIQYEISIRGLFYCHFMCSGGLTITIHCLEEGVDEWRVVRVCNSDDTDITFSVGNQNPAKLKFEIHSSVSTETANIALYSYGLADETEYVPPQVRDYKIVDHVGKTAKIVRNVKNIRVSNGFNDYTETMKRVIIYISDRFVIDNVTKAGNDLSNMAITRFGLLQNGNVIVDVSGIANMYWYPDISMLGLNGSETKDVASQKLVEFLTNNEMYVQYQLATPVEETITYVETDVSEVGYSWQDNTSPSPDIPSEVQGIEEINILKTGKNLFDVNYASNRENWVYSNTTDGYYYIPIKVPKGKQLYLSNDKTIASGRGYYANISPFKDKNGDNYCFFYHTLSGSAHGKFNSLTKDDVVYLRINNIPTNLPLFIEDFKHLQIEVGDVATAYEPYTEQHITITPPQLMYQNDIANVGSGEYEYNTQKYVVTGDETFNADYQNQLGYYGRYFILKNDTQRGVGKCNYLPYFGNVWENAMEGFCQNASTQIHLKFSNDRLGIADGTPLEEKRTAFANYLKQLYTSGNPLYVVVKVAKTTQPIPEEDLAKLKSLKTEQGVTNIFSNAPLSFDYEQSVQIVIDNIKKQINSTNANILMGG